MARFEETISVIIPTFNRAGLLEEAVASVLTQSYPPLEILICDDGSTDGTAEFVARHPDPRVKWVVAEKHSGWPGVPRNRGLRAAKGFLLAFLDDDDVWLPTKLERQIEALRSSGCRASSTDAWRFLPDRDAPLRLLGKETCLLDFPALLSCNNVICSSAVIERGLIAQAGYFPEDMLCEDYALWLRVSCLTPFHYIGEPLVNYRDAPLTSVRRKSKPEWQQQTAVLDSFRAWLDMSPFAADTAVRSMLEKRASVWRQQGIGLEQ